MKTKQALAAVILVAATMAGCHAIEVYSKYELAKDLNGAGNRLVVLVLEGKLDSKCPPNTQLLLDSIEKEYPKSVLVIQADLDCVNTVTEDYDVKELPTVFLIHNGAQVDKLVSSQIDVRLRSRIKEQLDKIEPEVADTRVQRIYSMDQLRDQLNEAGDELVLVAVTSKRDKKQEFISSLLDRLAADYGNRLVVLEADTIEAHRVARELTFDDNFKRPLDGSPYGRLRTFGLFRSGRSLSFLYGSLLNAKFAANIEKKLRKLIDRQLGIDGLRGVQIKLKKLFRGADKLYEKVDQSKRGAR